MTRPPRPIAEPLFSMSTLFWSVAQGVIAFGGLVGLYLAAQGLPADQIRAVVFAALVLVIFALILVNRRRSASVLQALSQHNQALGVITLGVAGLLGAVMAFAGLRSLFGFALPDRIWWAGPPLIAAVVLILIEALKAVAAKSIPKTV